MRQSLKKYYIVYRIMCIIKKVFYYEKTKFPVIKYKDEIWVKANTVANILSEVYKNTMDPNLNRMKRYVWKRMRKTRFI